MKVTSTNVDGIEVIRVTVRNFDADVAPEFARHAAPLLARSEHVVLDLQDIAFVDSSGLGAILDAYRELQAQGAILKIAGASGPVRSVMRMVGMHRMTPIFDDVEKAVASFASA